MADKNFFQKAENLYNKFAFRQFRKKYEYKAVEKDERPFRVRLVCHDADKGWILGKFARKMQENLQEMGILVDIAETKDPSADVNHYIAYMNVNETLNDRASVMVTHVDSQMKVDIIRRETSQGAMAVCMSKETMDRMTSFGIDRSKLCYINPAHDGVIQPKKYVIGLTHRCYAEYDFRKKETMLLDVCEQIDPRYFKFKIMGDGWDKIIASMREMGIEVDYYPDFDYDAYVSLIPSLDYYLYFGFDEGSMGYVDALAAGIKTIVTPQGYHLDAAGGPTHACETVADIANTLNDIALERDRIVRSVEDWTWQNYTYKHLELWYYMTKRKSLELILQNRSQYMDGIFSCLLTDIRK